MRIFTEHALSVQQKRHRPKKPDEPLKAVRRMKPEELLKAVRRMKPEELLKAVRRKKPDEQPYIRGQLGEDRFL